ncbi:MAG: SGNH/GDSL hydrolase family protein [Elusimicrobia bacterium]|nr:SGNH/GDSL hydrolase family protein [Elusimicrobiota bacterium]
MFISIGILVIWLLAPVKRWQWHVAERFDSFDCSDQEVCRFRRHYRYLQKTNLDDERPLEIVMNSLGFRGREHPVERSHPSVVRVQLFGDSNVFGIGAPAGDSLAENLERILQERLPGGKVEVFNFGLPGNYTLSNFKTYARYGRRYGPDVVIFGQPRTLPWDMNYRVLQIKASPFLTSMLAHPLGRWLINYYQVEVFKLLSFFRFSPEGDAGLRAGARQLLADQRKNGTSIWFFNFYEETFPPWAPRHDIKDVLPEGLKWGMMGSGLSLKAYRRSAYQIPGDGHPNAAGRRLFAQTIADHILPELLNRKLRPTASRGGRPSSD